jgi:ABC-type transporter Mla maintaining outer membrane lipid asymmetry permease subunit MlaE
MVGRRRGRPLRGYKELAMMLLVAFAVGLLIGLLVGALLERIGGDREEAASPVPAARAVTVEKPVLAAVATATATAAATASP